MDHGPWTTSSRTRCDHERSQQAGYGETITCTLLVWGRGKGECGEEQVLPCDSRGIFRSISTSGCTELIKYLPGFAPLTPLPFSIARGFSVLVPKPNMLFITSLSLLSVAAAAPLAQRAVPTVLAPSPQATISGLNLAGVESFRGIPFAQPPVGQLRLKPPQPITSPLGNIDGTTLLPRACPQFFFSVSDSGWPQSVAGTLLNLPIFQKITNAGEDCLTLNIQRPAGTKEGDKLPVLFWMFGGGFQLGSTQMYEATGLITESVAQGKPVILVAVNYRLGAFGWLPGKEILADGSSNLGLLDQRLAMKWVADNIAAFGGDPDKVTIWGESAGALSVMDHMMLFNGDHTYKGKPLFRAGIMDSGSVIPADPVDCPKAQAIYDTVSPFRASIHPNDCH